MSDPIRILVIDDRGHENLGKRTVDRPDGIQIEVPGLPLRPFGRFFDVRWLATPLEAREYMDRVRRLASIPGEDLREETWVPEILVFDYALLDQALSVEEFVEQRKLDGSTYGQLSPLPLLRDAMERFAVTTSRGWNAHPDPNRVPLASETDSGEATGTDAGFGTEPDATDNHYDVVGCYVGGSLLLTIGDHPCAPVPFTKHDDDSIARTDAAFFEWLLEEEVDGGFENKADKEVQWEDVFRLGLPRLRKRILRLVGEGRLHVALQDVMALLDGSTDSGSIEADRSFRLSSRFRRASLPVRGLFVDIEDEATLARECRDWAEALLGLLTPVGPGGVPTDHRLADAAAIAERIWEAYSDSDLMAKRERLSELTVLLEEDDQRRAAGSGVGAVDASVPGSLPDDVRQELEEELRILRDQEFRVVNGHPTRRIESLYEYKSRSKLTVRWAALFVMARLSILADRLRRGGDEAFGRWLLGELSHEDFHLALYPSPSSSVVLLTHATGKDVSNYPRLLDRMNEAGQSVGFALGRMLSGTEPFLPGEKAMLRQYALGLGTESDGNPAFFWERTGE